MPSISTQPLGLKPLECSREMRAALQDYVVKKRMKEREDSKLIQARRERQQRRQRDSVTLEKTKDELTRLHSRMEQLQKERHDLFNELKTVINQEAEQRRQRQKLQEEHAREAQEVLNKVGCRPNLIEPLIPPPPPPPGRLSLAASANHQLLLSPNSSHKRLHTSPDTQSHEHNLFSPSKIAATVGPSMNRQQRPVATFGVPVANTTYGFQMPISSVVRAPPFSVQHLSGGGGAAVNLGLGQQKPQQQSGTKQQPSPSSAFAPQLNYRPPYL